MASSYLLLPLFVTFTAATERFHACTSNPVYCYGPLLDAVQRSRIFPDSKTFVDMPMKYDPAIIMTKFKEMQRKGNFTKEKLKEFVHQNFHPVGGELDQWTPSDWVPDPIFIHSIKEPEYKKFARGLNDLWKILGRRMKEEIAEHPSRHSLLSVPHPFIVPGDRFGEFYYWDTYWIIKGLLLCDMVTTARHMIENFLHMVKTYGLVPNGGRIYFLRRSQPPMLGPMMDEYFRTTGETEFIKDNFALLEKEYTFWRINRTQVINANGRKYRLSHYNVKMGYPRPEGYVEDLNLTAGLDHVEATRVYSDVASACESGWDFSTRWFKWTGPKKFNLTSVKASQIIPVDLNTFLGWNEFLLAKFARLIGDLTKSKMYERRAKLRWAAMMDLLWHEEDGIWYDYDMSAESSDKRRRNFYPSNVFPLLLQAKGAVKVNLTTIEKVLDYLKRADILEYPGGIPTSIFSSGQQWDSPNAWAPLVSLLVDSLASSDSDRAKLVAMETASKWIESNYMAWKKYGHMYEKYNALKKGEPGGGGEYQVQVGFGWTNGVILELLGRYGDKISLSSDVKRQSYNSKHSKSDWRLYFGVFVATLFVSVTFCYVLRKVAKQRRIRRYRLDGSMDSPFLLQDDDSIR